MPARESVITHARTARFLAFLICISPASAWAAYQLQYITIHGEAVPFPPPATVPLGEWLAAGTAVMLAIAALLILRSKSLHYRRPLGGLLALAAVTALVGASGLHLASEAHAKATSKFLPHSILAFACSGFPTPPGGLAPVNPGARCTNGIALPGDQDPAADPELVILANPYNQPMRILQIIVKQPDPTVAGESIHFAPKEQTCFANDTLPPVLPDDSCLTAPGGGGKDCFASTVVLQPGATCNVVLADDDPPPP